MIAAIPMRGLASQSLMNTTQIFAKSDQNAKKANIGTGFFFKFRDGLEENKSIRVLVSNRHILEDAGVLTISLHRLDADESKITLNSYGEITIGNIQESCFYHPNKDVDLAVMLMDPLLNMPEISEAKPFIKYLDEGSIPTVDRLSDFDAIVDVIMVGYPQSLRDIVHNIPIFRQGITATPPMIRYNDEPKFLVDIATWPGSSGSPIFLYYPGCHNEKDAIANRGKLLLIGIISHALYSSECVSVDENNKEESKQGTKVTILNNIDLGVAIQSRELLVIKDIIKKNSNKQN